MREVYRKRGRAVRWENGTLVRVHESGVAMENERFTCHPDPDLGTVIVPHDHPDPSTHARDDMATRVESVARSIHMPRGVRIERLIVSEGEAEHTFRDKTWRDTTARIHLAIAKGPLRALIDLGDLDVESITPIADALARADETERDAPSQLRLAPSVTAALLPSLVGVAPPNVTLSQRAGGIDGKGNAIADVVEPWPNWYRPSYRVRPVLAPFNLIATCAVTEIDESRPLAIALLAPPSELTLRVLVVDETRVYPSTVRITRIDAISEPRRWYPYGAGAWGAEMML
jgi:hypothetical protein